MKRERNTLSVFLEISIEVHVYHAKITKIIALTKGTFRKETEYRPTMRAVAREISLKTKTKGEKTKSN